MACHLFAPYRPPPGDKSAAAAADCLEAVAHLATADAHLMAVWPPSAKLELKVAAAAGYLLPTSGQRRGRRQCRLRRRAVTHTHTSSV